MLVAAKYGRLSLGRICDSLLLCHSVNSGEVDLVHCSIGDSYYLLVDNLIGDWVGYLINSMI
jgi:hypothetical protein